MKYFFYVKTTRGVNISMPLKDFIGLFLTIANIVIILRINVNFTLFKGRWKNGKY